MAGQSGVADEVNNHFGKLLAGVVLSSVLSASAQMADGRTNYTTLDPRFSELATQGAANNINDVGQEITRRNLDVSPTIEIRPGFRMAVLVNKDITLKAYEEK